MNQSIFKISAAVFVLTALIFTAACSSSKEPADTEAGLKLILKNKLAADKSEDTVLEMLYGDFDGDGTNEAFAVVGDENEAKLNSFAGKKLNKGSFWFLSGNKASVLRKKADAVEAKKLETETNTYIVFEEYGKDSSCSFIWRVKKGEAVEEKISGQVGKIELTDGNITAVAYAEDSMRFEEEGKAYCYGMTEKPYYFYDNSLVKKDTAKGDIVKWDEGLTEYGAIEISMEDFLKLNGAKEIINEIEEKNNEVTTLFYRGNGLIHINYQREAVDEYICGNSTVKYDGKNVEKYRSHNGIYAAAATDHAYYPDSLF